MAKHDLGDIESIRGNLEGWMRRSLPGMDALSLGELRFPEESGESSVTLILEAENRGEQLRYICRMKPRDSEVFEDHDLLLQYQLMEIAGDNGIPVPPLLGYEPDESLVGSDFYLMGFVDGQVPTDNPPYAFGSWVTELSDDERATQWRNGLDTLARIHQIDLSPYDTTRLPRAREDQSPAQHELDKFNNLITADIRRNMTEPVLAAVDYLNANAPADGPRRLCWGDARPGNVIWKDLKPQAIIDWEMASLADPLQEVGWWYWIDYVNSVGLGAPRPGGLPSLEDIYDRWHEITGLPIDNASYYDLFTLTRYAIILERKFLAMEKAGGGRMDNFSTPFVEQQLEACLSSAG
jgi:aminoglycoside phosphotransferase (APT) family kinase protein